MIHMSYTKVSTVTRTPTCQIVKETFNENKTPTSSSRLILDLRRNFIVQHNKKSKTVISVEISSRELEIRYPKRERKSTMATSWFNKMKRNLVVAAKGSEYDVCIIFFIGVSYTHVTPRQPPGYGIRRSQ